MYTKRQRERYSNPVSSNGFSSSGTSRLQGRVGQTSLSRTLVHTPFKGPLPVGHGGCCGTYKQSIVDSCDNSTPSEGKSTMTSKGLYLSRVEHPTSVFNPGCESSCSTNYYLDTSPLNNSASSHTKTKVNQQMAKCYAPKETNGVWNCDGNCKAAGYYIGGKYFQYTPYARPTNIMGSQEYQATALARNTCMDSAPQGYD